MIIESVTWHLFTYFSKYTTNQRKIVEFISDRVYIMYNILTLASKIQMQKIKYMLCGFSNYIKSSFTLIIALSRNFGKIIELLKPFSKDFHVGIIHGNSVIYDITRQSTLLFLNFSVHNYNYVSEQVSLHLWSKRTVDWRHR